jgi:hypothetical protein
MPQSYLAIYRTKDRQLSACFIGTDEVALHELPQDQLLN